MARILLGVTGGIAAYKALEFVRLATAAGHAVRVIQTPASRRFVGEASFAALTGAPVLHDDLAADPLRGAFPGPPTRRGGQAPADHVPLSHLELARNADLLLIAPAGANTIAKLAAGLADNLLAEVALAATCPLVIAPAMNNRMYEHPATQANLATLRSRGATIIDPGTGRLGSPGEAGIGRLPEPADILKACERRLAPPRDAPWAELNVLVSAGGTREPIDAVRYVGNHSSGRMGFALADEAAARGAAVTVVAANVGLPRNPAVRYVDVVTAADLERACLAEFPAADVLLMAAAVADFRPTAPRAGKLAKTDHPTLDLELEPTTDVLALMAEQRRAGQTLVGFAAEHGSEKATSRARGKLARKRVDAIVVNDISRPEIGFDAAENEVTIITADGDRTVARAAKHAVARAVLDAVDRLRDRAPGARAGGMLD